MVARPRDESRLAALAVVGTGYLFVGSTALFTPMKTAGVAFSSASVWHVVGILGHELPTTHLTLAFLALVTIVVILGFADDPPADVTASLTTLTLGAAYMLPGYVGWSLPTAALHPKSLVSRIAAAEGVLLVASYEIVREHLVGPVGSAITRADKQVAPFAILGFLAVLVGAALQARLAARRLDRSRDLVARGAIAAEGMVPEGGAPGTGSRGLRTLSARFSHRSASVPDTQGVCRTGKEPT